MPEDEVANPMADYNEYIRDWISRKWANGGRCPMCDTDNWSILPMAEIPVRVSGAGGPTGIPAGMAYQTVPVLCNTCWFVAQLLAGPLGLLRSPAPSPEGEAK